MEKAPSVPLSIPPVSIIISYIFDTDLQSFRYASSTSKCTQLFDFACINGFCMVMLHVKSIIGMRVVVNGCFTVVGIGRKCGSLKT